MVPAYCVFSDVLSPIECQQIIDVGQKNLKEAHVMSGEAEEEKRRGKISWFVKDEKSELHSLMQKCVDAFGDCVLEFFGVKLSNFEPLQFSHYKAGDFYGWHYDAHTEIHKAPRHFSATIELSNPAGYEGGGLEFHSIRNPKPEKKQGNMIIFPSMLLHRALKVNSGVRHSLVIWGHV